MSKVPRAKVLEDEAQIAAALEASGCADGRCMVCERIIEGEAVLLPRPPVSVGSRPPAEAAQAKAWLERTPAMLLACRSHVEGLIGPQLKGVRRGARAQLLKLAIVQAYYLNYGHPTLGSVRGTDRKRGRYELRPEELN